MLTSFTYCATVVDPVAVHSKASNKPLSITAPTLFSGKSVSVIFPLMNRQSRNNGKGYTILCDTDD